MDIDEPCCWICLSSDGDLARVCNCPADRVVHRKCLARWQLQSAGKSEERFCRFCAAAYPNWKETLTPPQLKPAIPVVSVHYNGMCYRLKVRPGPEGLASFQKQLQCITGMSELDCMQITFQCRAPETSEELNFKGINAFDAAIHCASISAAERHLAAAQAKEGEATRQQQQAQQSQNAAAPVSSSRQGHPVASSTAAPVPAGSRHAHTSHQGDADRRDAAMASGLYGHRSQVQAGTHSLRPMEAHLDVAHAEQHACPTTQQRGGLRRVQDLIRGLFA